MRTVTLLSSVIVFGCLPRPQPAAPSQANPTADAQSQPEVMRSQSQNAGNTQTLLGQAPMAPQPYPQPAPQPYPQPAPQPYPQPAPQPYPQPSSQPYSQPSLQPNGIQPTPQQPPLYPQPQLYPLVQPYTTPQPYPAPTGADATLGRSSTGKGEVIADLATVGSLASVNLLVRQHVTDGSAGTLLLFAGLAGGGATGWLLTENYTVDSAAARATTIGMLAGAANAALLIEPTHWTDADQVLGLLLLGSAVGTAGGFVYGQAADLTSGQSTFIGNLTLLGSTTAAFSALAGSRDGKFGGWEDGILALGLNAGVLGGALIAPSLDWSPRRSKIVFASTAIGAFLGGMLASVTVRPTNNDSTNGDLVAGCMTGGMWGGFALGILMTKDSEPDSRFRRPTLGSAVTVAPFVGDDSKVGMTAGMMVGGSW
jgi:hypothetical protein